MSRPGWQRRVDDVAELLVWNTMGLPAALGEGRLVCVDGHAGSGKTTLGRALLREASTLTSCRLLHMDDMYAGWSGLGDVARRVERDLVAPLARGVPGAYRRYDWHRETFAERVPVDPVGLLVLEGVGSSAAAYHQHITSLVWVEAPRELCIERGVARDGPSVLPHWLAWMDSEDALFAREGTRDRADVVVDGSGDAENAVVFE